MIRHCKCPLCQKGDRSNDERAKYIKSIDGSFLIKCSNCGEFRMPSSDYMEKVASGDLSDEQYVEMRRVVKAENGFGMIPLFSQTSFRH